MRLASKTRANRPDSHPWANEYLTWGAGPRASQYLVIGAKCHAAIHGKYSPDIEDVRKVAVAILRHRIVRNYKAEAAGISIVNIIDEFLKEINRIAVPGFFEGLQVGLFRQFEGT